MCVFSSQKEINALKTQVQELQIRLMQAGIPVEKPEIPSLTELSYQFVYSALKAVAPRYMEIWPSNEVFTACNETDALNIIAWDLTDKREYYAEIFDCDKFARLFWALVPLFFKVNTFFLVWDVSSAHAYNGIVFPSGNVWLLEPQSDTWFFVAGRDLSMYGFSEGMILV